MANSRKIQAEVDRALKKTQEGLGELDDLWPRYTAAAAAAAAASPPSATALAARERVDGEIKKRLRKLQRLRDQIRTWIGSAEIKVKKPLQDARKAIEAAVDRHKTEREAAGGLGAGGLGAGGDPRRARYASDPTKDPDYDALKWLSTVTTTLRESADELQTRVDNMSDELAAASRKGQARAATEQAQATLTETQKWLERHEHHLDRLESAQVRN